MRTPFRSAGFTLSETLICLLVTAILLVLLGGTLQRVRASSEATSCLQKMRHLGVGAHLFMSDNNNALPYTSLKQNWMVKIAPYLDIHATSYTATSPKTDLFLCPADKTGQLRTYRIHQSFPSPARAKNYGKSNYTPVNYREIANPSTHAMIFCITFHDSRTLGLWTFDNSIWKRDAERLHPPGSATFGRPHYHQKAINILYSGGNASAAYYPLPDETWHFDGP